MIHSMSGGIIKDVGDYTFVKVRFDGEPTPFWYVAEMHVSDGDKVIAPLRGVERQGVAERVERHVSGQVTPVPLRTAKRIVRVVEEE